MGLTNRLFHSYTELKESEAEQLSRAPVDQYTVEVHPPQDDVPATLDQFVRGITEYQTAWLGVKNASPVAAYEIRRATPDRIKFYYSVPSKRMERRVRTHLSEDIPEASFEPGEGGLPVSEGDSVGGGLITVGREDWYPLRTGFDDPPINSLISTLHRHAMQDTRVVVQILFQPVIGKPVRNWWWIRRSYQRIGYLRKDKSGVLPWHERSATPRERKQAKEIENKAGSSRFHVAIRFLVIGAGEYTPSRVKEIAGGFNTFEDSDIGQYLNTVTVTKLRESRILDFAEAVRSREFNGWSLPFQASVGELAALVTLPNRRQQNIQTAQP